MFIETATTVFGGRRDRLMVWAFEQYETYIAYHAPLSPFERSRWLVATALRTAHPYADLSALDTEEHVDCVSSLPLARTAPVVVSQAVSSVERREARSLTRLLCSAETATAIRSQGRNATFTTSADQQHVVGLRSASNKIRTVLSIVYCVLAIFQRVFHPLVYTFGGSFS